MKSVKVKQKPFSARHEVSIRLTRREAYRLWHVSRNAVASRIPESIQQMLADALEAQGAHKWA